MIYAVFVLNAFMFLYIFWITYVLHEMIRGLYQKEQE